MKTNAQPKVLVVEDDVVIAAMYKNFLSEEPMALTHVDTGNAALSYLNHTIPHAILLDLGLPDMNGMDILKSIQQQQLGCTIIVITMESSIDIAVEAMRCGAFDFLEKPFQKNRLIVTLCNALRQQHLSEIIESDKKCIKRDHYYDFIGDSKRMQALYQIIDHVAASKASVLITGESGTGKELCAQAIYKQSQRSAQPFITLDCTAIPKDLIESQLFGHVKGAFTGAVSSRKGVASLADGGTLFLDEIGEMDLALQAKLLRFMQTGTFYKVGGEKEEKVDVRFICATNRDLLAEIEAGQFREDLYNRINVVPIVLPALRKHREDILRLARVFLKKYAQVEQKPFQGFTSEVENILLHYDWPGNVRQLQSVIQNIVVLHEGYVITTEMLPSPLNETLVTDSNAIAPKTPPPCQLSVAGASPKNIRPLWQVEKEAIEEAIKFCDGNVVQAAKLLKLSKSSIYHKLQLWKTTNTP